MAVADPQWGRRTNELRIITQKDEEPIYDSPRSSNEHGTSNNSSNPSRGLYTTGRVPDGQADRPPYPLPGGYRTSTVHSGLFYTGLTTPTTAHRGGFYNGQPIPTTAQHEVFYTGQPTTTTAHHDVFYNGQHTTTTAQQREVFHNGQPTPTTAQRDVFYNGQPTTTTAHHDVFYNGQPTPTTANHDVFCNGQPTTTTAQRGVFYNDRTPATRATRQKQSKTKQNRKPKRLRRGCISVLPIVAGFVVLAGSIVILFFRCELLKSSCHEDKPSVESVCNTTQSAEYGATSEFVCLVPLEGPTAIALRQTSARPDVQDVVVTKRIDDNSAQVIRIRDNVEVDVAITAKKEVALTVHLVDTTCLQTGNFTVTLSNQTHAVTSVVNIILDEKGQFYCPCTVPGDIGDHKNVQCKLAGDLDTNIGLKRKTEKSEKEELLALFTIDHILNSDGTIAVDSMNTLFLDMARIGDSYSFSLRFLSIQCSVEGLYVIVVDSKRFETYVNVKGEGVTMVPTIHTYSLTDNRQGIIADFNMEPYKATIQCTASTMCASGELKLYQYDTATKRFESIESASITQRTTYNGDLGTVVLTQTLTKTDVEAILEKDKYIITCKFTDSMGIEYMSDEFQVRVIRGDWCASSSVRPGCNTFHPYDCTKFIQCDDSLHETDCVAGSGVTYWNNIINNQCYGACTKAPPSDKSICGS